MLVFLILGLLVLSFACERYLLQLHFSQRQRAALCLHSLLVLLVLSALVLVFHRPFFSAILTLAIHGLFMVINQAKYKALQEPMVFSDLVLFLQAFKFPRLYFPFINPAILIISPLLVASLFYAGLSLETAIYYFSFGVDKLILLGLMIILVLGIYFLGKQQTLTLKAKIDLQQQGLLVSLCVGTIQSLQLNQSHQFHHQLKSNPFAKAVVKSHSDLSDVIVVQSESFFDVRRLYPHISSKLLKNYDAICSQSITGELSVPAWGANTMRSEFAFLTACDDNDLGLFRYYPYHYVRQDIPSIAAHYQKLGYKTVCIHPHAAAFFERQRVFPLLGFDEFIDITAFGSQDYEGAYISDLAVAEKIIQAQQQSTQPVFIFAITMENHGPLHLEQMDLKNHQNLYQQSPDFEHHDLSVYLRHLNHADAMIHKIRSHLHQYPQPSYFCFYGDHVPSLPNEYQALGFSQSQSDYFIWANPLATIETCQQKIAINQLGLKLVSMT